MIARRALFALAAAGAGLAACGAQACSLVGRRDDRFSDTECRRSLAAFVQLLAEARTLPEAERVRRVDDLAVQFDDEVQQAVLFDDWIKAGRDYAFYARFTEAGGRPDRQPPRLIETHLLKGARGHAIYQFAVRREQFHPADPEGCNGLFTHDDFYGPEVTSYLGIFRNNRLAAVRAFPEWRFAA